MSFLQTLTSNRPSLDAETTEYLGRLSKTKFLNHKDLELVSGLHGKGYGGAKLNALVPRVLKDKSELDKMLQRVDTRQGDSSDSALITRALLRATSMTPRVIYSVINCEEEGLHPLELSFLNKVKQWAQTNVETDLIPCGGGGSKKQRRESSSDEEDSVNMSEPPNSFQIAKEALEAFCDDLRAEEIEFRVFLRDAMNHEDNRNTARRILDQVPSQQKYNALVIAGVHEEVPTQVVSTLARYIAAYGFVCDISAYEESVENGTDRLRARGTLYHSIVVPLVEPQFARFGGTPFLQGSEVTPSIAFIMKDLPRQRMSHEQFGQGPPSAARQTYYIQAVYVPEGTRTPVCVIRGIGLDHGIFEYSVAVATRAVQDAAAPILDLFENSKVMTTIQYYHRFVRTNAGDRDSKATWAKANEVVLNVFIVTEGFDDDHEATFQLRKALMTGPKGNILQAGGLHFLVCPDNQSPELNLHNLPDEIIHPVGLQFSELSNLTEGLTLDEVLSALVETCHDMHRIRVLYITRQAEYDVKTGIILPQGQKRDSLILGWDGEPPEIGRTTTRMLCVGDGRNLPIIGNIPGAAKHKALDSLMRQVAGQSGPDGRPGKVKYPTKSVSVAPRDVPKCAPRRRENDGGSMALGQSGIDLETAHPYESSSPSTPAPRRGERMREANTFFSPASSSQYVPSTALNLSTGERSISSPSSGGKTPGYELSTGLDQMKDFVRHALEAERERNRSREEERDRKDRDRDAAQEARLNTTVQQAVNQSLTFAFGSADFTKMLVTTVHSVVNAQAKAPPTDGASHSSAVNSSHV